MKAELLKSWEGKGFHLCRECQVLTREAACPTCRRTLADAPGIASNSTHAITPPKQTTGPNNCEARFRDRVLLPSSNPGDVILFEGITFRLRGGNKYTPDFVVYDASDGGIYCYEVKKRTKNGYRHPSYNRSQLAFNECKSLASPAIRFYWAEEQPDATWVIK